MPYRAGSARAGAIRTSHDETRTEATFTARGVRRFGGDGGGGGPQLRRPDGNHDNILHSVTSQLQPQFTDTVEYTIHILTHGQMDAELRARTQTHDNIKPGHAVRERH